MAHFKTAHQIQLVHENRAFVVLAIAIGILKYHNPVVGLGIGTFTGIAKRFRNPDAATVIQCQGHGLVHVRLASE